MIGKGVGKAAMIADVHVGNHQVLGGASESGINQRCMRVIQTLFDAVVEARKEGCTHFIIAGDLFDSVRPSPQIMAKVGLVLSNFGSGFVEGAEVHMLLGNHDRASMAGGDHALGPLRVMGHHVWEEPGCVEIDGEHHIGLIPYRSGPAYEWLPDAFAEAFSGRSRGCDRAVMLHLGLRDEEDRERRPWLRDVDDAVGVDFLADLCSEHGVGRVYAGNWHEAKAVKRSGVEMVQIGALCPTGWDNPGLVGYGGLEIWPSADQRRIEILGPRFITIGSSSDEFVELLDSSDDNLVKKDAAKIMDWRIKILVSSLDDPESVRKEAQQLVDRRKIGGFIMELEDSDQALSIAEDSVKAAVSSDLLARSVAEHVEGMKVERGVDKMRVLNTAREYLAKVVK